MPADTQLVLAAIPPIRPRGAEFRYASLPLCILDAVYSLGEQYPKVEALVGRYVRHYRVPQHRPSFDVLPPRDEQLTTAKLAQQIEAAGPERFAGDILQNMRPTSSSRNAPLRSVAALEAARTLAAHGVAVLQDVARQDADDLRRASRRARHHRHRGRLHHLGH